MLGDQHPTGYRYADAGAVLRGLGFDVAPSGGGSHRKWRLRTATGETVVIGLVEKGNGTLKPYLIREMLSQLRDHGLIPLDLER